MHQPELADDHEEVVESTADLAAAASAEDAAIREAHRILDDPPAPHPAERQHDARASLRAAYDEQEIAPSLESTLPIAHVDHRQEVLATDQDMTDTQSFAAQHESPETDRRGRFHRIRRLVVSTGRHVSKLTRTKPADPEYKGRHRATSIPEEVESPSVLPESESVSPSVWHPHSREADSDSTSERISLPSAREYYRTILELAESPFRDSERTPGIQALINRINEWGEGISEGSSIDPGLGDVDERQLRINLFDAVSAAANRLGTTLSSSERRDPAHLFTGDLTDRTSGATVTEIGRLLGVDLPPDGIPTQGASEFPTRIQNVQIRYMHHSNAEGVSNRRLSMFLVRVDEPALSAA